MSLLKQISEYFLGTETRRWERENRAFYREYIQNENGLKKLLKSSEALERSTLIVGRWIPNLATAYSIAHLISTNDFPITVYLAGEFLRIWTIFVNRNGRRELDKMNESLKHEWEHHEAVSDLADKIRNEGEEWKNRN